MNNIISQAGYESVSNSDDVFPRQHGFRAYESYKTDESVPMQSIRGQLTESDDLPPILDERRSFWEWCNSYWVWETVTSIISMACLGIVVWALIHMDGSQLSTWPLKDKWTFASFLSSFVTISRFMMLTGVAEGIGQLRWLYYLSGPHRLDHLDSFESASRGPWGSILFTCRRSIKGMVPFIARLGALVTIVALAMDPFTQQLLEYPTRSVNGTNSADAWVSATNIWANGDGNILTDAAKRQSTFGGVLDIIPPPPYNCASGNCTWGSFTSLGYNIFCQSVANTVNKECVTGYGVVDQNCTAIRYSVPDYNLSLVLQNASRALIQTSNDTRAFSFLSSTTTDPYPAGLQSPIIFSFIMAQLLVRRGNDTFDTTSLRNPSWNITKCDVQWTSYLYEGVNVVNGSFNDVVPQTLDLVPLKNSSCWTQQTQQCQEFTPVNVSATPSGSGSVFRIEADTSPAISRSLLQFDFNMTVNGPNFESDDSTDGVYNIVTGLFWNVDLIGIFKQCSTSLTNRLRSASFAHHVGGTSVTWATFVNVRWGWFALPAAANLGGPIFLLWVVIYTARGVGGERLIWKTNTVPLLMHGLQGYHRYDYAGAETSSAIFRKARGMTVQLRRNKEGEIRFANTGSHENAGA